MSCQSCQKTCASRGAAARPQIIGWRLDYIKVLRWLAFASMLCAYLVGQQLNQPNWLAQLEALYPDTIIQAINNSDNAWTVSKSNSNGSSEERIAILTTEKSFGGPLQLITLYDADGKVHGADILHHNDTPAYIQKLVNKFFFDQFQDKAVVGPRTDKDFDAVSGATISSEAIKRAHYIGLEHAAALSFGRKQTLLKSELDFGSQHCVLIAFLILAVIAQRVTQPAFSLMLNIAALGVMGFWLNQMISASNFTAVLLGYLPSIYDNLAFWILSGGVLLGILVLGRNIYCGKLCPFSALQSLLAKLTGLNFPVPKLVQRYGGWIPKVGLWIVIMVGLLTTVPIAGSYEPFSMIFSLQGVGVQWAILPAVVVGCTFVPQLFCRYFCPAGQGIEYLTAFRNWLVSLSSKAKRTGG
ncbi:FMN-binding protein [Ferrimonas sp. SCSIO 43195]|uniref:FMN-binding protein n=1 Tax=Ferrimonas sp. SCSIO 43195 TaxID=2822844 RepID=UPI002075D42A|nr:FMN-binding protein [Ferrimonas sp. SCSIO 43195]USD37305.1 FMN-binding protein [Ferrimonas sp. SCSIO 43195]